MTRTSRPVAPLLHGLLSLALLVGAAWLLLLDPTVARPQVGPDAGCSAAWDTVLKGADNVPGGELAPDAEDVAKACRRAGKDAFAGAVGLVTAAGVLAAWTVGRVRRRSDTRTRDLPLLVRAAVHPALLLGVLFLGLAAVIAVGTALEDVADLRMGDLLLGWAGYLVAAVLAGIGGAGLAATELGPRLWRGGEVAASVMVLGGSAAAFGASLVVGASLLL